MSSKQTLRAVPHENYIKVLILSGIPVKPTAMQNSIDETLVEDNYNSLPEHYYELIEAECRTIPGGSKMIDHNRIVQEYNAKLIRPATAKKLLILDVVAKTFRRPDVFYDLVNYQNFKRSTFKCTGVYKILYVLRTETARQYIECCVLTKMALSELIRGWNDIAAGQKSMRLVPKNISIYVYYFWNCRETTLRKQGTTRLDIMSYLDADKRNEFYRYHRELLFREPSFTKHKFGTFSEDDRRIDINVMRGKTRDRIIEILNSTKYRAISADILDLFKYTDAQIKDSADKGKSVNEYKAVIEDFKHRIVVCIEEDISLDELKNQKIDPSLISQDQPANRK